MHGFRACKTMCAKIVDSNLYGLIYNELTDILFLYILPDEDMLNTKGLATLTEHQGVSWRLIKVENWDGKNFNRLAKLNLILLLMKLALLKVID